MMIALAISWTSSDAWVVLTGVLVATSCALLGNFLVLRGMSMMGDAISHAVLPGLAVAFVLTGSRHSLPMFIGAAAVGLLTAVLTQWIHNLGQVEESASMGVVFTALFAVGLIMLTRWASHVDLDPECVLYGSIELVPLDSLTWGDWSVPRAVITSAVVLVVNVVVVIVFFKELKISAFDPQLSTTLGFSARAMHYLLMALVAVTTVASFESVGSILVIAMLIVPAAAAYLLTQGLGAMMVVSVVIAVVSAVGGHWAAGAVPGWFGYSDTYTASMMAVVSGLIFAAAMLLAPRQGVVSKLAHRMTLSVRICQEDILGLLYRRDELAGTGRIAALGAGQIQDALMAGSTVTWLALRQLLGRGKLQQQPDGYQLTSQGRAQARTLVRSHRLWESYLVKHLNLPVDHVHNPAHRLEHITDAGIQRELAQRTDQPDRDPQGKVIPSEQK